MQAAGLTSVLADPNLAATVFAPTNEAFVKALSGEHRSHAAPAVAGTGSIQRAACCAAACPAQCADRRRLPPAADLSVKPEALLANKALLTSILQLHIIPGKALASGDLRDSKSYESLLKVDGKPVEVKAAVSFITKLNGMQRATSQIVSIVAPGGPSAQVRSWSLYLGCLPACLP